MSSYHSTQWPDRVFRALFFSALIAGAALRLWGIGERSLWHDEGHTMAFVRVPAASMNRVLALDDHPPLYYWALRYWLGPEGSVARGRCFSALCSLLTLPLVFWLGRALAGRQVALGAMALMAVSPQAIYYAQELRMYSLQTLFVTAAMCCACAAFRSNFRLLPLAAAFVFGVLACYTHYVSGVFLVGLLLTLILARRAGEAGRGSAAVRAACFALVCVLLYWPWLSTGLSHVFANAFGGAKSASSFAPQPLFQALLQRAFETCLGFIPALPLDELIFPPARLALVRFWGAAGFVSVLGAMFALGLAQLWRERESTSLPSESPNVGPGAGSSVPHFEFSILNLPRRSFLAAFLVIPFVLMAAYEVCGGRFYPRFLLPLLPVIFLCAAKGISLLPRRWERWAFACAIGSVMLASSVASLRVDLRDVTFETSRDLLAARAKHHGDAAESAPVAHASQHSFWNLMGYDPAPGRHKMLAGPDVPALARLMYGRSVLITARDLAKAQAVWVVYSEWNFGPPTLRREIEPRWFGEGWRVADTGYRSRFIKKIEWVLYERIPR